MLAAIVVLILTVGLAAVWTFVAHRQLASSLLAASSENLDYAHKAFERARARTQTSLQAQCRVLVEDPRLKSTLATEGMDEATVVDILTDLGKLRGSGFLMVLSPQGRVFAEAGAPELRGLDLSASSVVKAAQSSPEASVGSWVLAGKVMDLSVMAIRFDTDILAYLVVGESVDKEILEAVAAQSGVAVASALGTKVLLASSGDEETTTVLTAIAAKGTSFKSQLLTVGGHQYAASAVDLAETAQSHRLVIARSLATAQQPFELLRWMIFVPPLLMLIAVLFSMSASRSPRRSS